MAKKRSKRGDTYQSTESSAEDLGQHHEQNRATTTKRRQRYIAGYVRMPEERKAPSLSMWVYNNRIALYSTVIAYLLFGIIFVGGKITTTIAPRKNIIAIDMQEIAKLERERDRLLKEVQQRQQDQLDWNTIANRISNENATKNATSKSTKELIKEAKVSEEKMAANREALEKGEQEIANIRRKAEQQREAQLAAAKERQRQRAKAQREKRQDAIIEGNVTVVYAFSNPTRHAQHLVVPAYQCEGGGKVTVAVTLDRDGDVTSAKIISGGDDCMRSTAERAARESRFDSNEEAPNKHEGYITYLFVPQ